MQRIRNLSAIPDEELLQRLAALLGDSRHTEADLVAHVAEVDARRLYAREATPSMFQYCTERLHLSEAEAYLRIAAGRAAREHPAILTMLADGRLHLTAIALLAPHLTPENRDALLARATHKTKRQIEEMVAEIAPRPDAPALIRKLPERRTVPVVLPSAPPATPDSDHHCGSPRQPSDTVGSSGPQLRLDEVASNSLGGVVTSSDKVVPPSGNAVSSSGSVPRAATMKALSPGRYRFQFTASAELREKLERLQALMRSSVPDGDIAVIIEAAVTEKLERLEARRFARTRRPRKTLADTDTSPETREIPAAVKRSVDARDEGRCAYVDSHGRRCTARVSLQFHHRHTFASGGDHSPANVSLQCFGHNRYLAEIDFGREAIAGHAAGDVTAGGPR